MLKVTGFEKASTSSTSSAAETNNICLAKHELRILAERTSFPQTVVGGAFKNEIKR